MSKKFRKYHKNSERVCSKLMFRQKLGFAGFGLRVLSPFKMYRSQIAQYRAIINKVLKTNNKLLDRRFKGSFYDNTPVKSSFRFPVYPFNTETGKSQGSRMGKGKGAISDHYFFLQEGRVFVEFYNTDPALVAECLDLLKFKISVPLRIVSINY